MLPKLTQSISTTKLPSTSQTLDLRPMLVREEMILLKGRESGQHTDIMKAIKQVINNCVITPNFDINTCATFDVDWLFLFIRMISISNVIDQEYEDGEDGKNYKVIIDLSKVEPPKVNEVAQPMIPINGTDYTLFLRYVRASTLENELTLEQKVKSVLDRLVDGNHSVTIFAALDDKEVDEWIKDLPINVYDQIITFIDTAPTMQYKAEYKNSKGTVRTIELKTLSDFFTLD